MTNGNVSTWHTTVLKLNLLTNTQFVETHVKEIRQQQGLQAFLICIVL